jgi:tRNA A-37 threonylcarbamoyl transferase component Bud32
MWCLEMLTCIMLGCAEYAALEAYPDREGGYIMLFGGRKTKGGSRLDASVGRVLAGRYRVTSTLGAGGMAVVYKAEDAILGRTVALKTLRRRYAEEPDFRRRFVQEARAMASLDHENIVKVYDICRDGEAPFIVVEYVEGDDLGSLLKRAGRMGEEFTRRMAEQLLRALAYAHRRGVIHRDIKPSNILITSEGKVKVADFGIARLVEEEEAGARGEIVGSARYMSPEQLKGSEGNQRSDLYSAGILLYHCLTGRTPFSGDVKSLARQQLYATPRAPRKVNRRISPGMEEIVLKALAKDPAERYRSATAMLDDLEREPPGMAARVAEKPSTSGTRKLAVVCVFALLCLASGAGLATGLGLVELPAERVATKEAFVGRAEPVERAPVDAPGAKEEKSQPEPATKPEQTAKEEQAKKEQAAEDEVALAPVPDVRAYFDYSAEEILVNRGFEVRIVYDYREGYANRGVAWGTDPAVGAMAPAGSVITVYATPKDLFQPQIDT